jgi:hypothetical protein
VFTSLSLGFMAAYAVLNALLLPLLWRLGDPRSNAGYPAFRASVAGVAAANAITPHPPADAMEPQSSPLRPGGVQMIHALLVVAVILFVLWLLFHATGGLVNLIWLVIIVLVGLWLFGLVRSRSAR